MRGSLPNAANARRTATPSYAAYSVTVLRSMLL